jgi:tetratricopeptide (TPR) repeat protein
VLLLLGAYIYSPESFYLGYSLPKIFSRFAPLEAFIAANVFLLVAALLPRVSNKGTGEYKSDGMQLVKVPFMKEFSPDFAFETLLPRLEAYFAIRHGDFRKASVLYEELINNDPDDALLKHDLAIANLGLGEVPEARQLLVSLIDEPHFKKPESRAVLFNNIAWTSAVEGTPDLLAVADKCSQEAIEANPNLAMFNGTRGTVLVCSGRSQEGIDLLKTAYRKQSIPESRAACAAFYRFWICQTRQSKAVK